MSQYSADWASQFAVCTTGTEACYFNECPNCANGQRFSHLQVSPYNEMLEVAVILWQKKENAAFKHDQFMKAHIVYTFLVLCQVCRFNSVF
jgi:hypothetical protein